MRSNRFLATVLAGLAVIALVPVATALGDDSDGPSGRNVEAVTALGSGFTYQGRLTDAGSPANGTYDLRFILYDAETAGSAVGTTQSKEDVVVTNGLFSVDLDFGAAAFNGDARWVEIAVRPGTSAATHTVLSPRQPISPAPYALFAKAAGGLAVPFSASGTTAGASTTGLFTVSQSGTGIAVSGLRTSTDVSDFPGVLGTNAGGGAGVQGESTFASGIGVQGISSGLTGAGGSFSGTSSVVLDGPIKVTGDKTAFVHQVDAGASGNTCNPDDKFTIIDNALLNGDPNAILIVTWHGANGSTANPDVSLGVVYNSATCAGAANKWAVYTAGTPGVFSTGDLINVLIFKQ